MSSNIDNNLLVGLGPKHLWEHFRRLTLIPRPSAHEDAALDYAASVGAEAGCEVKRDEVGNVYIYAPASSPSMAGRKPVILQAHIDMVPQKDPDVQHDFVKDPIKVQLSDGWLSACGTTLGADNGIGAAAALAAITDPDVERGPIVVVLTREEETSMRGANALQADMLQADMLLNLDSEQEGEVYIGCASGVDLTATFQAPRVPTAEGDVAFCVSIDGLKGGHSGMDINLGRANANKLMARFLKFAAANYESMLASFEGGNMRNAIPRSAQVVLTIDEEDADDFAEAVDEFEDMFRSEFATTEPQLTFVAQRVDLPATVIDEMAADDLINALQGAPNGPLKMSADLPGLVETSSNMAIVRSDDEKVVVKFLIRSSMESEKEDVASTLDSIFRLAGAEVELSGDYPGWEPNVRSQLLALFADTYMKLYDAEPKVMAVHAGLECGIIGHAKPGMDMVSFGPTIRHPHSPTECVEVASVGRFWDLLRAMLRAMPCEQ